MAVEQIASRKERFTTVLAQIAILPPATNALVAYRQLAETLNAAEDEVWGRDHWAPPRTFLDGSRTDRLYPIAPESFHPVAGFPGVTLMLAKKELVFVSRFGAIEIQGKMPSDPLGEKVPFAERLDRVLWSKLDAYNDGVWHPKNRV